jgi:hypothetical protein
MPFVMSTYLIDKRQTDEHHQLILLTPLKQWYGPFALLARILFGHPLRRVLPNVGNGFLRLKIHDSDGVSISTGKVGEYICAKSSAELDSYIGIIARRSKMGLVMGQVRSRFDHEEEAAVVYDYHVDKPMIAATEVFKGAHGIRNYQFNPRAYEPEAKPSLVSFMHPIVDGCYAPDMVVANLEQAVKGRIRNVMSEPVLDPFLIKVIDEFCERFLSSTGLITGDEISMKGTLVPVEIEEVYDKQNRPTQRRIFDEAEFSQAKRIGKSFMKREAYGKISDPRIITTINGVDKLNYSRFIYAIADMLKMKEWYAFGKNPLEISFRVVEICSRTDQHVGQTDFSRFDGTVNPVIRYLEERLMVMAFRSEYTETIIELMRSNRNLPCFMTTGKSDAVSYDSGFARLSGSPETACFNSIANAFCAFLAWRMTQTELGYFGPDQAWNRLGIYGGDDGLTSDLSQITYERAARKLGLKLTYDKVARGKHGVTFLNRVYGPQVWYGEPDSHCDVKRAITKFHATVHMPQNVTNEMKLVDKAFAYWLTDRNTPIIGAFVSAVVKQINVEQYNFKNYTENWYAQYAQEVQFPNEFREWMLEDVMSQLPLFNFDLFIEWIGKTHTLTSLMQPPCFMEKEQPPSVTQDVIVEGDLISSTDSSTKIRRTRRGKRSRKRVLHANRE